MYAGGHDSKDWKLDDTEKKQCHHHNQDIECSRGIGIHKLNKWKFGAKAQ